VLSIVNRTDSHNM